GVKGALRRASPALDPVRQPKTRSHPPTWNLREADLMTKAEVASLLRVSPRTVQNYLSSGILPPPAKLGRRLLWRRADIEFVVSSTFHSPVRPATAAKARRGRPRKY